MFYLHDEPGRLRFALVQRLDWDELRDLESCWRTAESIRCGRPVALDIRRLTGIDEQTRLALQRLREAGASMLSQEASNACRHAPMESVRCLLNALGRLLR